jgi:hypothetical protein
MEGIEAGVFLLSLLIKYNKIIDYIRVLSDKGQGAGQPYI